MHQQNTTKMSHYSQLESVVVPGTRIEAIAPSETDLGQFGAAVSAMVVANVLCEKMCVYEILWRVNYKGCLLHKWFCILMASVYFCWHEAFVCLHKSQACTAFIAWSFTLGIILIAFHSQSKNITYFLAIGCLLVYEYSVIALPNAWYGSWITINTA